MADVSGEGVKEVPIFPVYFPVYLFGIELWLPVYGLKLIYNPLTDCRIFPVLEL